MIAILVSIGLTLGGSLGVAHPKPPPCSGPAMCWNASDHADLRWVEDRR